MTIKFNAGEVTKVSDEFLIDPRQIVPGENGRWQPHSDETIQERVDSFKARGQLEAVECRRRDSDGKLILNYGFCRYEAAMRMTEATPSKPFLLRVRVVTGSAEDGLVRNIVENHEHNETTFVDDAFNQKKLRDVHNWTDAKIAALYGCHKSMVSRLKLLTGLRKEVLELLNGRDVSFRQACDLARLDEPAQDRVIAKLKESIAELKEWEAEQQKAKAAKPAAVKEGKDAKPEEKPAAGKKPAKGSKPTKPAAGKKPPTKPKPKSKSAALDDAVRTEQQAKGGSKPEGNGGKPAPTVGRTLASIKEFWKGIADGPGEDANVRALAGYVLGHISGAVTDVMLDKKLNALVAKGEIAPAA